MLKIENEEIKKYPVFYQGEEYEIRIENGEISDYVYIYKVKKHHIFNIKITRHIQVYMELLDFIVNYNKIVKTSEDYYVKIFETAFEMYLISIKIESKEKELKNKQLTALQEWDGIIE